MITLFSLQPETMVSRSLGGHGCIDRELLESLNNKHKRMDSMEVTAVEKRMEAVLAKIAWLRLHYWRQHREIQVGGICGMVVGGQ